jgi:hypothetical protein
VLSTEGERAKYDRMMSHPEVREHNKRFFTFS